MEADFEPLEGGCLCGAVRYRVTMAPLGTALCHCRMCQRSSGGPAQASAEVPAEGFAWLEGEPRGFRSSPGAVRHFCPRCGSQLTFRPAQSPRYVSVNVTTLDRPQALPPRMHIWCSSRIPWFKTADDLPCHEEEGPPVPVRPATPPP